MPQLEQTEFFLSQLFWLAIFFTFLLVFLWRISLPRIAIVLEKRQNKIDDNLSSAKELQEQAIEIEKKINIKINNAKEQTENQIRKTISSLSDEVNSKLSLLDKELETKISKSEKEIIKNKENQMKNINDEIAKITKITLIKISGMKLSDSVIDQAIKSYKGNLN
tara:strand:- start:348 stop:842 length:495 start_codon:yes stop_codon:yes gene_type:complete